MNPQPATHSTESHLRVHSGSEVDERFATDAELLSIYLATGNRVPMESLMRRYWPMVASVCRATVSDPNAAEDAFQATFLIFLKSAKKIRKQESVGAWLHGVAYRTACRLRQQRRELLRTHSSLDAQPQVAASTDPLAEIARQMELEVLDQELQLLPSKWRDPLVEHFLLGHTALEIAERMDLSASAVEGRIRRGKLKLRGRLARRGVSLSVAVAATGWFQSQVQAAESGSWFTELLHGPLAQWSTGSSVPSSPNVEVSTLVEGELTMLNLTAIKLLIATSVAAGLGAVLTYSSIGLSTAASSTADDAQQSYTLQALPVPVESTALAQIAQPPRADPEKSVPKQRAIVSQSPKPSAQDSAKANSPAANWTRPEGTAPEWLQSAEQQNAGLDEKRNALRQLIAIEYNGVPLRQILENLSNDCKITMYVNRVELDALGADFDAPITLSMPKLSLREALNLILEPLDLDYKIHESYIEVTSADNAEATPRTCYYDLAHILPGPAAVPHLTMAIEQSCSSDGWLSAGGHATIVVVGSLMVVSCAEETHFEIEALLANVAKIPRANLESALLANPWQHADIRGTGMGGMF